MAKKSAPKANASMLTAILYILVGALVVIFRSGMLGIAMTIAGVFFIVSGILEVLKLNLVGGAISIVIGIAILILGWIAVNIVLLVLGILMAVKGVIALLEVLKKKKKTLLEILFPVLVILAGLLLAFGNGLDLVLIAGGILLIANGVIGLLACLKN